jgi:hypothetical protein
MAETTREIDPQAARQFAVEVVEKLRAAGFEALWAGGCVRDQLLGKMPKDYDVATSARPEEIRDLFGRRRTLAIGASFGVISVLGPKAAGQIEVATFRRDAAYSDGRHPDSVSFSNAQEDAQRRDFTINGLFYDPLQQQVIDYVGGEEDLKRKIVRAIGQPLERIAEDKLRMLRAVRFAATFDFELDGATLDAVREQAHEIVIVSAERIAAEMRRMLVDRHRARAVELLFKTGLLEMVLPEARTLSPDSDEPPNESRGVMWRRTMAILSELKEPAFGTALAALLRELPYAGGQSIAHAVGQRWRLARDEWILADWLLRNEQIVRGAERFGWPQVQRVLIEPEAAELIKYGRAVASVLDGGLAEVEFCEAKLALPWQVLNPPPLITGADLQELGLSPGPAFREILEKVRDLQLTGQLRTTEAAREWVQSRR